MTNSATVVSFGEALWDSTPKGLFVGGAPANVSYHLSRLGLRSVLATGVGEDYLGREIRRRFEAWGMSTELIATVLTRPTGVVQVELSNTNNPSYDIFDNVAWDHIPETLTLFNEVKAARAFVFGSLALRHEQNRALVDRLLTASSGLVVFDVNLRPPYYNRQLILALARRVNMVKVNESELEILHPIAVGSTELMASAFSELIGGASVCVTCGSAGAGLWLDHRWYWAEARPISLKGNAVGAGDSFLAGLISGLLSGVPPLQALNRACRLAELVAGADGAQPDYDPALLPDC